MMIKPDAEPTSIGNSAGLNIIKGQVVPVPEYKIDEDVFIIFKNRAEAEKYRDKTYFNDFKKFAENRNEKLGKGPEVGATTMETMAHMKEQAKDKMKEMRGPTNVKPAEKVYTADALQAIYKKDGMKGLKKVGDEFNVTDRSSKKLIKEIITAQNG